MARIGVGYVTFRMRKSSAGFGASSGPIRASRHAMRRVDVDPTRRPDPPSEVRSKDLAARPFAADTRMACCVLLARSLFGLCFFLPCPSPCSLHSCAAVASSRFGSRYVQPDLVTKHGRPEHRLSG